MSEPRRLRPQSRMEKLVERMQTYVDAFGDTPEQAAARVCNRHLNAGEPPTTVGELITAYRTASK